MTTLPPQAPDDDDERPVRSERPVGTSSETIIANWGFGLVRPFSVRPPPRRGTKTTRPLPPALSRAVRLAGCWTLRLLSRLRILHVEHTSRNHQLFDPSAGAQRIGGPDVRDTS